MDGEEVFSDRLSPTYAHESIQCIQSILQRPSRARDTKNESLECANAKEHGEFLSRPFRSLTN